jgi:hypothetical protein
VLQAANTACWLKQHYPSQSAIAGTQKAALAQITGVDAVMNVALRNGHYKIRYFRRLSSVACASP